MHTGIVPQTLLLRPVNGTNRCCAEFHCEPGFSRFASVGLDGLDEAAVHGAVGRRTRPKVVAEYALLVEFPIVGFNGFAIIPQPFLMPRSRLGSRGLVFVSTIRHRYIMSY